MAVTLDPKTQYRSCAFCAKFQAKIGWDSVLPNPDYSNGECRAERKEVFMSADLTSNTTRWPGISDALNSDNNLDSPWCDRWVKADDYQERFDAINTP